MTFTTNEMLLIAVIAGCFSMIIGVAVGCFFTAYKIDRQTYSNEKRNENSEPTNY